MTVYDNVAYGLRLRHVPEPEVRRRVRRVLELVGLTGLESRYPGQLSGGQQQRVALARALAVEPEVLLLDEPLSNLDARLRLRLRAELKRLQRRLGLTLVYVTHDQEEALSLADRIAVMRAGRVEQVDTPEELYRNPRSLFTALFVGRTSLVLGRVVAATNGHALVKVGDLLVEAIPHGVSEGDYAAIVVRADVASMGPREGYTKLEGQVTVSMFLGAYREVRLRLRGSRYEASLLLPAAAAVPEPGSTFTAYIPRSSVHVFPPDPELVEEELAAGEALIHHRARAL